MKYVFCDESGIHAQDGFSVFSYIYIEQEDVESVRVGVVNIERACNISLFHWAHTSLAVKNKCIERMLKLPFFVKIAIVKNPIHPGKEMFRLLPHILVERDIFSVIIDGAKSKPYEHRLKKVLRNQAMSAKKVRMVSDSAEPCLRLADMVAGLVRSWYDSNGKRYATQYVSLSKNIIIEIH